MNFLMRWSQNSKSHIWYGKPRNRNKLALQSIPQLQEVYLANALVNPYGLFQTFYKIDLLLKHQNGEFKRFWADKGSLLQEIDKMF